MVARTRSWRCWSGMWMPTKKAAAVCECRNEGKNTLCDGEPVSRNVRRVIDKAYFHSILFRDSDVLNECLSPKASEKHLVSGAVLLAFPGRRASARSASSLKCGFPIEANAFWRARDSLVLIFARSRLRLPSVGVAGPPFGRMKTVSPSRSGADGAGNSPDASSL